MSNRMVFRKPTRRVSGPAQPHLGDGLGPDLGIEVGRIEALEDRLDAHLAVERLVEDELGFPERLAVANLQEAARSYREGPRRS